MKSISKHIFISAFIGILLMACDKIDPDQNRLTEQEVEEGWKLLFDGRSTKGWHLYNEPGTPSSWVVIDGELYCDPYNFEVKKGDLVTDREYEDFELQFEWKITKDGNSGVFINVQEDKKYPNTYSTGLEYQLLDGRAINENSYLIDSTKRAGTIYGLSPYSSEVKINPPGEWNHAKIQHVNGRVSFWLNGEISSEADLKTLEWQERVANSEFNDKPDFAKKNSGKIGLQYWAKGVSFRNIKILEF